MKKYVSGVLSGLELKKILEGDSKIIPAYLTLVTEEGEMKPEEVMISGSLVEHPERDIPSAILININFRGENVTLKWTRSGFLSGFSPIENAVELKFLRIPNSWEEF